MQCGCVSSVAGGDQVFLEEGKRQGRGGTEQGSGEFVWDKRHHWAFIICDHAQCTGDSLALTAWAQSPIWVQIDVTAQDGLILNHHTFRNIQDSIWWMHLSGFDCSCQCSMQCTQPGRLVKIFSLPLVRESSSLPKCITCLHRINWWVHKANHPPHWLDIGISSKFLTWWKPHAAVWASLPCNFECPSLTSPPCLLNLASWSRSLSVSIFPFLPQSITLDVEDLDEEASPEDLMLSYVSGEKSKVRDSLQHMKASLYQVSLVGHQSVATLSASQLVCAIEALVAGVKPNLRQSLGCEEQEDRWFDPSRVNTMDNRCLSWILYLWDVGARYLAQRTTNVRIINRQVPICRNKSI